MHSLSWLLVGVFSLVHLSAQAAPPQQKPNAAAQVRAALEGAGYACQSASAQKLQQATSAVRCRGKISGYSKAINVYIPSYLAAEKPLALVYHFHGFWTQPGFNPFLPDHGDFGAYLTASGRNALMIIPECAGKNETFAAELSSSAAMNRFFSNIETPLKKGGLPITLDTSRVLTGHSGAYVQLGKMGEWAANGSVPHLRSVVGIGLFDSVYGGRPGLAKFLRVIRNHSHGQYFSAWAPNNSAGKNAANNALQRELGAPRKNGEHQDILFVRDNAVSHMRFMRVYMTRFLKAAIAENGVVKVKRTPMK